MATVTETSITENTLGTIDVPAEISAMQAAHAEWARRNFGTRPDAAGYSFLGIVEEVGELAHAILKRRQGIRGTEADHDAAERDAVADIIIFTLDFASRKGFDLTESLNDIRHDGRPPTTFGELQEAIYVHHMLRANPDAAFRDLVACLGEMAVDLNDTLGKSDASFYAAQTVVALCGYCVVRRICLQSAVRDTLKEVWKRDWTKNRANGQTAAKGLPA